jgi:hypothetical protein
MQSGNHHNQDGEHVHTPGKVTQLFINVLDKIYQLVCFLLVPSFCFSHLFPLLNIFKKYSSVSITELVLSFDMMFVCLFKWYTRVSHCTWKPYDGIPPFSFPGFHAKVLCIYFHVVLNPITPFKDSTVFQWYWKWKNTSQGTLFTCGSSIHSRRYRFLLLSFFFSLRDCSIYHRAGLLTTLWKIPYAFTFERYFWCLSNSRLIGILLYFKVSLYYCLLVCIVSDKKLTSLILYLFLCNM